MPYLFLNFSLLLGLVVGSFLNVVALRYNSGRSLGGRSRCLSCSMQLRWYDLVPVFSYVALRGRCRGCGSGLALQYPIVELLTGLVFALTLWTLSDQIFNFQFSIFSLAPAAFYWSVWSILIAISVYDLRHKIIPDGLVWVFNALALVGLAVGWIVHQATLGQVLIGISTGPIVAAPLALIWLISRGRAMGLGDAKLALGLGWLMVPYAGAHGWLAALAPGISAVVLAFWLGAILGIAAIVHSRVLSRFAGRVTMKSEIPFGPYLAAGTFIIFVTGFDLLSVLMF